MVSGLGTPTDSDEGSSVTVEEAIRVVADRVTAAALQEVVDNGLWDTYIDEELTAGLSAALKDQLVRMVTTGPDEAALSAALRILTA